MDEFAVSVLVRDGCRIVSVCGPLDADTAPYLGLALDQLAGGLPVIVSLAEVSILTSAGIQALLRERDYGRLVVFCPAGNVSRILEVIQAHRLGPIYRDLDAALAGLGTPGSGRRAVG
jgi:anti-anti-sigma factor